MIYAAMIIYFIMSLAIAVYIRDALEIERSFWADTLLTLFWPLVAFASGALMIFYGVKKGRA